MHQIKRLFNRKKEAAMIRSLKPVRIGILIGLLGIVFGIGWAVYLVVGHESIHQTLDAQGAKAGQGAYVTAEGHEAEGHGAVGLEAGIMPVKKVHTHRDGSPRTHASLTPQREKGDESMGGGHHAPLGAPQGEEKGNMYVGGHLHDNPAYALAHTRLVRGHLHAMGLGLVTILISLILAFTTIGERIKTAASVLMGLGGVIYPIAWVVMGYLTPALGPEGAEASVIYIAGPGVVFMLLGVFTAIFSISRDILNNKD